MIVPVSAKVAAICAVGTIGIDFGECVGITISLLVSVEILV